MCSGQAPQEASGWGGLNKLTFSLALNCQKLHLLWHQMSDQQQMPHPRDPAPAQKVPWEQKGTE